jgi:hypothetical protein
MIKSKTIRLLLFLSMFGAWILLHYTFDKKDAEGLTIYAALLLLALSFFLDRRLVAKHLRKSEQNADV